MITPESPDRAYSTRLRTALLFTGTGTAGAYHAGVLRALHEEKQIAAAFPDQWPAYVKEVPRFIPRRLPTEMFVDWNFSQWLKNREYQAFCAVLFGLVALQVWHLMLRHFA